MPSDKKVKELMIPLEDYPHIPYWFSLRQAMAIFREATIKFEGSFEPRAILVFDEKYRLKGILTLREVIKGLEPVYLAGIDLSQAGKIADLFGPGLKETAHKKVSEVMSLIKATISGEAPLAQAIVLMLREDVGLLPVIEDGKVIGIIRLCDLFQEISEMVLSEAEPAA